MKKFFALVLALVMALSLTTVAWGASATVSSDTELTTALASATAGDVITFGANITIAATADSHNIATNTGIYVPAGVIIDGAGYTLTVTGAGDETTNTTDSAIKAIDGITVKNLKIVGGARGIYIAGATTPDSVTKNTVFENLTIVNSCRAYNLSGACAAGVTLTVSNCTLAGQSSSADTLDSTSFIGCTFVTNGSAKGDFVEPKGGDVTFDNCVFNAGFEVGFEDFTAGSTMDFENCVYAGAPLTEDNMDDLFDSFYDAASDTTSVAHAVDGADKILSNLYAKSTGIGGTIGAASLYYFKAVAPVYDMDTGVVTNQPSIAYYLCPELTGTTYLVEVTSLGAADVVVYNDVNGKAVLKYLAEVDNVEYEGKGVAFANFGKACGQYKDANYDKTAKYYSFENVVYKAVEFSATALMVNGKLVPVDVATGAFVEHIASYTYNDKFEVTAVKCSECGKPAVIAPNFASLPDAVKAGAVMINDGQYFYFPAAAVSAPSTDKVVESAQTFDAGIAMYVGMSVMAAAGSAVVIGKKKD